MPRRTEPRLSDPRDGRRSYRGRRRLAISSAVSWPPRLCIRGSWPAIGSSLSSDSREVTTILAIESRVNHDARATGGDDPSVGPKVGGEGAGANEVARRHPLHRGTRRSTPRSRQARSVDTVCAPRRAVNRSRAKFWRWSQSMPTSLDRRYASLRPRRARTRRPGNRFAKS